LVGRGGTMVERSGVRWLLLFGVGLILLAAVGALIYDRWAGSAALPPAAGLAGSRVTARRAFAPAAGLAGQWQEDARLAAVFGGWSAVGMQSDGQVEWAFQFFSPSVGRLALITVAGGRARMVHESASPHPVPTFSTREWRVDNDQALWTWWERGGEDLVVQHPDADLAMQLRMPDEGGEHPVWTVAALAAGTETALIVTVDAASGAVVE
jgi:hypothetical protein